MDEIVEERGDLRVRLEVDSSPEPPYSDGSSPLLKFEFGTVTQVACTSYVLPENILRAARRFGAPANGSDMLARYLRIFHGMTSMDDFATSDADYLTFDTAHWRESVGLTDELLAARSGQGMAFHKVGSLLGIQDAGEGTCSDLASLDEWRAYCEGEVYGYVIERRVKWRREGKPEETRDTWELVESICGFYGHDVAEQVAREQFEVCAQEG